MIALVSISLLVFIYGVFEKYLHQKKLKSIPIRIHVNGTRGKSTVTRLIAAGLRAADFKVVAKTTGSAARLIFEDGAETPIKRRGSPNIFEQVKIVSEAAKRGAQALVIECMAVHPETQWVSEHSMLKSTIGVITNIRADHLDVMGPTLQDVALALSGTIPTNGQLVTTDGQFLPVIREVAAERKTTVHIVDADEIAQRCLPADLSHHFTENIACALKVCELLGVDQEVALRGMSTMTDDPGALKVFVLRYNEHYVYFVNAFAANDVTSTQLIFQLCFEMPELKGLPILALMNNRFDRQQRTRELCSLIATWPELQKLVLVGEASYLAKHLLVKKGFERSRILDLTRYDARQALSRVLNEVSSDTMIFALGNIKGIGWEIIDYFEENGELVYDCSSSRHWHYN